MDYDVAVVGAGIVGLAHAYALCKRGLKVIVFERSEVAPGASVRNFGMVWPIGQPPGEMREIALESRAIWIEMLCAAHIWHQKCGSLHLAYQADELQVLHEFCDLYSGNGYICDILAPEEVLRHSPVVLRDELQGALYSPDEVCVNPRTTLAGLPTFLAEGFGVHFEFGVAITSAEDGTLVSGSRKWKADHVFVCGGQDFETLYPELAGNLGMVRCRLQMMKVAVPDSNWRIGPHLCAGLTIAHYKNFRGLSTLQKLLERFKAEYPEHMKYGVHVLVSQHQDGNLTVGDSHIYDNAVTPFSKTEIDDLIWSSLGQFLPTASLKVIERWVGVYAHHPARAFIAERPEPRVTYVSGVGGAGMTLSFGIAERQVAAWHNER